GWASAPNWKGTIETAHRINRLAAEAGRPVALVATADGASQPLTPADSAAIEKRLDALAPRPYAADYRGLLPALSAAARAPPFGGVAWLSDGLGGDGPNAFADFLRQTGVPVTAYADTATDLRVVKPPVGS